MSKIYSLSIFIASLFSINIFAQNSPGKVLDDRNKPIDNVKIENLRTQVHDHTNGLGDFVLNDLQENDSIRLTKDKYVTQIYVYSKNIKNYILTPYSFSIEEVTISGKQNQFEAISKIDLSTQPVNTSQELLRKVPGLFIGQHAGGGKAEQIFIRGFDVDHGTDVAISVDGMPVNMVSHAHGQGYADLHFIIPETVDKIDFDKGAYSADHGNFNTAGYVDFKTKKNIDQNSIIVEAGQFNTLSLLGMFKVLDLPNQDAYFVADYNLTDGYFDASQDFHRLNLFGKYTGTISEKEQISISLSRFTSKWNASGQIPDRAVADGSINYFGAIDDTEGGNTDRSNINVEYSKKIDEKTRFTTSAFYSNYNFQLFSNFTFFLEDPINGDQIRQKESRDLYGLNFKVDHKFNNPNISMNSGIGFRMDNVRNIELSRTKNRVETLENLKLGNIDEHNLFAFSSFNFKLGKLLINPAVRLDYFKFSYEDFLAPSFQNQEEDKVIASPKLNFFYEFQPNFQTFLKLGKGFHSNDTRVVVAQEAKEILPASYNADLGFTWKPIPKMVINAAIWYLFLEQEFVYVGDAGIVEPSGKTERKGIDVGARYEFAKSWFFSADYTYTDAKSVDDPEGENYIPLAPKNTFVAGISAKNIAGFSGGLYARFLGDRPANEDNSIVAEGYFVTDFNLNYKIGNFTIGAIVENVLNTRWKETQFATESRLFNEPNSVEEIHFTPGTPFALRGSISYQF
ncbi:TonB-dependent receptor [Frigoriflavimonas asaccharolytica]|uniref:Outer membrane receptor protein involved in Fe transport n=1 Tax=Frigoriflavimonas asaccharolytica TaxID=2735899 RepID=A0A8J8K441_9FLAO|nr:TonB-dependent receptor [Frigoriflavimonas asaccharolytica]NRS91305.1 outer membrane receptor protein involved in Fe transport [Frigoriflavimonas asaccharolytica]